MGTRRENELVVELRLEVGGPLVLGKLSARGPMVHGVQFYKQIILRNKMLNRKYEKKGRKIRTQLTREKDTKNLTMNKIFKSRY